MQNKLSLATLAVHAGYKPDSAEHSTVPPIYQTNAYTFESVQQATNLFNLSEAGNIYSRLNNPTVAVLEEKIAALDGGVAALAMSSGHAVIFSTILNLANSGDEIISSINIYGGAINLLGVTLRNVGINCTFVDTDDLSAWEAAITPKTRAFFVESVGNPHGNIADIEALAKLAHSYNIPLIVDSTFATPMLNRPIEHGADFVVHSATKFLAGQGSTMAGVVVDSGKFNFLGNERFPQYNTPDASYHGVVFAKDVGPAAFAIRLRTLILRDVGACLSPFNAFLVQQGMETLHLRMKAHCSNTIAVAKFLESNPEVELVNYSGLESSKYYELSKKYMPDGAGSVFTFSFKKGKDIGVKFIEALEIFAHVANVGDTRSLVIQPSTTTHSQLSESQLKACNITAGTIRLSVGIECIDDLIADLDQAIKKASK